ncbi:MAG: hypothetical protein KGK34_07320 [Chloroflexota bacterium]|nr:hypothetical protein [Chloroflexota bacterium]
MAVVPNATPLDLALDELARSFDGPTPSAELARRMWARVYREAAALGDVRLAIVAADQALHYDELAELARRMTRAP